MITFRDAVQGDFAAIAPLLRYADQEEWRMGSGKTPVQLLKDGYRLPTERYALNRVATDDYGTPLLVYGVNPMPGSKAPGGSGWVWLVANERAPSHYHKFRLHWDDELHLLGQVGLYDRFETASWVGNERHHRWLEAMGFVKSGSAFAFGPYAALFQPFARDVP